MFKLLLPYTIILAVSTNSWGQCAIPLLSGTSTIGKESVVDTGKPKTDMFRSVRSWIVKKYPSYSKVIQVEDLPGGQIIYKATAEIPYGRFKSMIFTVTIDMKDNKYRSIIDGLGLMGKYSDSYVTANINDLSIDGDACTAVSKKFSEIDYGLREFVTAKGPIIPRPAF